MRVLLHCMGTRGQEIFETLQFADAAQKNNIKEVTKQFDAEFCPKKNITYEHFQFNSCSQARGQTAKHYITELRRLANTCEFGVLCDSFIIDRLICGIRSHNVRERLLRLDKLTMDKAIDICKTAEMVNLQVKDLDYVSSCPQQVKNVVLDKENMTNNNNVIKRCKFS